ncbi:MAG: hypothetical protein LBI59_05910, partial [Candidatus Accumulibacter sp.]|nr:hypothetical protein [Accumulibacter sp.]
ADADVCDSYRPSWNFRDMIAQSRRSIGFDAGRRGTIARTYCHALIPDHSFKNGARASRPKKPHEVSEDARAPMPFFTPKNDGKAHSAGIHAIPLSRLSTKEKKSRIEPHF